MRAGADHRMIQMHPAGIRAGGLLLLLLFLLGLGACAPRMQGIGPTVTSPELQGDAVVMSDAGRLALRSWLPGNGAPQAVVLALHGFNDYAAAFAEAGAEWPASGIALYAYDQRGFGASPGRGMWPGADALRADLREVTALVSSRHPGVPLFLLGHSMGGAVVMTEVVINGLPPGVTGLILAAPAVWSWDTMPWYQRGALWAGARLVPWMELSAPKGIRRYASDNIEMLMAMGRDPMVVKDTRVDALAGLTDLMDQAMAAVPRVTGRVLVLYGDNEDILPAEPVNRALAAFPAQATGGPRLAIYPQGWHMILRDLQGQIVRRDIAHWVLSPDTALPSGADNRPPRIPVREGRPELPRTAGGG